MGRGPRWTSEEETLLQQKFPVATWAELTALFPGRPQSAIRVKASKLGITKNPEAHERGLPFDGSVISHMSESEKGYLAGILDGEGTIRLSRRRNRSGRHVYHIQVVITTTSQSLLAWLQDRFPQQAYLTKKNHQTHLGKKQVYRWVLAGNRRCIVFLREIASYLVIKRERAELLAQGYVQLSDSERERLFDAIRACT